MMAVKAPILPSLSPGASSTFFSSDLSYPGTYRLSGMADRHPDHLPKAGGHQLSSSSSKQQTSPHQMNVSDLSNEPTNTNHNRGDSYALDHDLHPPIMTKRGRVSPATSEPLKVGARPPDSNVSTDRTKIDTDTTAPHNSTVIKEDEPPVSVIHAPAGFREFNQTQPSQSSPVKESTELTPTAETSQMTASSMSTPLSSAASDVTVTRPMAAEVEIFDRYSQMPPLQTQIPIAPEWTKTPRAQTRKEFGVSSRPGSTVPSLASISEAEDDHPDHPTDFSADETDMGEDKPTFYRNEEEDIRTLQEALTECWTLCNTLAGLSYVHREKLFSKKGDKQQQAWRSCWSLCQNLYNARNERVPMNVRLTLDLCREFCQALFEVRAKENEDADSVLRVSFELNNHLFNTHDRSLPEAFSERTLDFYITLCHRLMKQRSNIVEETGPLLRTCWSLAEMLFSIRQNRREGRKPEEDLLSSAIQACWELCDLFRDGWTRIRPERQTPRPAQTTLTQAFQQARRTIISTPSPAQPKLFPETPTTIFEDIAAESPYETSAPNIVVLGPGDPGAPGTATSNGISPPKRRQPRESAYKWPTVPSTSSVTTLSTTSSNSPDGSIRTVRSPTEDPNMALLKSLFVRAAVHTNRGFSPLSSTTINTVSSLTSLPMFVKSLPENAFGSQAWQMGLFENYRKAIANDQTFRSLGVAANPTLLGIEGDESTRTKIRADTARAIQTIISGTLGWSWLRDLFRFSFGVHVEDVLLRTERK